MTICKNNAERLQIINKLSIKLKLTKEEQKLLDNLKKEVNEHQWEHYK